MILMLIKKITNKVDEMVSLVLPKANTDCMNVFLAEVERRYPKDNILMVVDNASWHRSKNLIIPENITLYPLLPYTPELNPIEMIWDELREKFFKNDFFNRLDAVVDRLCEGLLFLENNNNIVKSITGWKWIVNMFLNANQYKKRSLIFCKIFIGIYKSQFFRILPTVNK